MSQTAELKAIAAEVKGFGDRLSKQDEVLEGLLKVLAGPASKAGITPVELLARMSAGNDTITVIGGDGASVPVPRRGNPQPCGWGEMVRSIALLDSPTIKAGPDAREKAFNHLKSLKIERSEVKGDTIVKAALAESSGLTGGYTVPPMFADKLLALSIEDVIMRPRAFIQPMTSLTLSIPYLDVTTVQAAGTTPFLGGILATWTAEAATRAESEPQVRQMELKAHELSFYALASNTFLADNVVGFDTLLTQLMGTAIGWYTDYAYLQGNGVGKPLGILNAPATIAVKRANANRFQFADAATMMGRFIYGSNSWRNGKSFWAMHPSVLPQLLQMVDPAGRPVYLPLNMGAQEMPGQSAGAFSAGYLFSLPCLFTEKLPVLGSTGDVLLLDGSKYVLGDRAELTIDVSTHIKFLNNQTAWRVVWRGDGQSWLNNPVTLADGAFTVSPFVELQ